MNTVEALTEKEYSRQIYELCRTLGFERYHTFRSDKSPAGFPDEVLARERVVFLEVKREKGKLSPFQKHWIRVLFAAGAEVYVVRPRDLQDLATVLGFHGRPLGSSFSTPRGVTQAAMRLAAITRAEAEAC